MMKHYDHRKIEAKWQREWERGKIYNAAEKTRKPKHYSLMEFPYPSGDGLHAGHVRGYTAMDIISRKRRMEGHNVLYPIGWDAFGLPTENYAIKTGKDPRVVTKKNTDNFRKQFKSLGMSFDWSREINTTDPGYYKWTQWIFLQFFKKGLAYKAKIAINWCPSCKIGLANEEVVAGSCERCGSPVEKREKEQWMLAITKYAERLDKDLDAVDYLPQIKLSQRNWIGKSVGAEIKFKVSKMPFDIEVFTTRPDTIFGATYLVLSPEHLLLSMSKMPFDMLGNGEEVASYIDMAKKKTEMERTVEGREKTGVELKGIMAINPATKEEIPVWIADYVLPHYGTGAIMAVPAHDERDFEFAKKYGLPVRQVIMPDYLDSSNPPRIDKKNTKRKVVHIILRNEKDKTVLIEFLTGDHWGENKPRNFIIGGVEDNESEIGAARREIKEETGYTNIKFVEKIPLEVQARFFAAHKDVNRTVHVHTLIFSLLGAEREEISEAEKKLHDLKWIPENEVANTISIPDDKITWKYLYEGGSAFEGEGVIINSGEFSGMESEKAKKEIVKFVGGKEKTTFKLRDWVFSRQRYWGEPIPIIHCAPPAGGCGYVPVPEKDLPVVLPKVKNYQPTDSGESPLANITKWVNVKCPKCKGKARRETDTMPNWAGSSWYYLRYTDPKNTKAFADKKKLKYWLGVDPVRSSRAAVLRTRASGASATSNGVDWYNGGFEHTTLHLLYSRFWHKFLFDLGFVPTGEPYRKRTSHGIILAEGGEKMSKSRGNVVNPDDIVKRYGADTLRLYEMFMGPFDQAVAWSEDAIIGPRRFLERVWNLQYKIASLRDEAEHAYLLNNTIKKVSDDLESMKFNTAISALMIFVNEVEKSGSVSSSSYEIFLKLLSPLAPHITEEIWRNLGHKKSIHQESWPIPDVSKLDREEATFVVQVNGRVRGQFRASRNIDEAQAKEIVLRLPELRKWIESGEPRFVFVPGKLINIVI